MDQSGAYVAKVAATLFVCILATQYLHELGHALMAKALGYDVLMTINRVSTVGAGPTNQVHANLITLAGPLVTIALALTAFALRKRLGWLAPIILWNTMTMRALAMIVSLRSPNDEAKLSADLGWGTWTLPVLTCALLLWLFVVAARESRLGWRWYLGGWIGMSFGYGIAIMLEPNLPRFNF